ncbi:DUF58 domain-containing protein [Janibacter cremeus]|uniref:Uncharacterized protein (DUF58 family) n=1 Tax=Janibacter cremeus TaxID=1285192 RepID=A0A852VIV7_9MICO|nr:DUF58 domain-containing protein [Janibacter cremeus]NYF97037.1 uncharacterized protein (DUF58 family) [Janibacter cremeus]
MTLRGRVFVGAGVLIALAGMVLGLHDLTRVGALLVTLPLLASLLARRSVSLEVTRSLSPARVAIDGHADVTLRVRNTGRSTSPLLRAEEGLAYALGDRPHLLIPRLRRDEERALHYRVRSHVRGHHAIGELTVRTSDPFGLATRSVAVPGRDALVVLPRTLPLLPVRGVPAGSGGESASSPRMALHGEDDIGVREYRIGDDLRRIHWRSTARTGETMVRQDEEPARRRALVVLDDRARVHAGTGNGGSFEWAVTAAASITALLLGERFEVHLHLASDEVGRAVPLETIDLALDLLAAVQPSEQTSAQSMVEALEDFAQHGGGLVVTVIGALAHQDAELCAARAAHGLALVIDRGGFDAGSSGAADLTAQQLALGGWCSSVVRPGDQLPRLWEQLVVGRAAHR